MSDPILDDLDEMFPDTITIESYVGTDSMGDNPTYGAATSWKAKIRGCHMLVRDAGGREQGSWLLR